jgi:predicted enzyme related to lactoylglutathione lyase
MRATSWKGKAGVNFVSVRVITDDAKPLVEFYERATGPRATWYTDDFVELMTPSRTLAIAHTHTIGMFGAVAARPADNRTAIIQFIVDNVVKEHDKLLSFVSDFVQQPTAMPWGNRSLLFRDPDGNLVNCFTPVTQEAIKKFEKSTVERG